MGRLFLSTLMLATTAVCVASIACDKSGRIAGLKEKLRMLVDLELYMEAARVRDEIRYYENIK